MRDVDQYYLEPLRIDRPGRPPRRIDRPTDRLKGLQRRILDTLSSRLAFGNYVHGCLKGKSPRTLAQYHRGQRVVIRVDIEDFFPSISFATVERLLRERLGASGQVGRLIARLLTRGLGASGERFLPQGSPASPLMANLALMKFDRNIDTAARRIGARYGRYVDDIVVSGDRARDLIPIVIGYLRREGFKVARRKLLVMPRGRRQVAVGLNLQRTLSPTADFRSGCEMLLVRGRDPSADRSLLAARLAGKLSYAGSCEGAFARRLQIRAAALLRSGD